MPLHQNPLDAIDSLAELDAAGYGGATLREIGWKIQRERDFGDDDGIVAMECEAEFETWWSENLEGSDEDPDEIWALYWGCPSSHERLADIVAAYKRERSLEGRSANKTAITAADVPY